MTLKHCSPQLGSKPLHAGVVHQRFFLQKGELFILGLHWLPLFIHKQTRTKGLNTRIFVKTSNIQRSVIIRSLELTYRIPTVLPSRAKFLSITPETWTAIKRKRHNPTSDSRAIDRCRVACLSNTNQIIFCNIYVYAFSIFLTLMQCYDMQKKLSFNLVKALVLV